MTDQLMVAVLGLWYLIVSQALVLRAMGPGYVGRHR